MKAIRYDGTKLIFETNYPKPTRNESLVKVRLAGICGTDLEILQGYMSFKGVLGHEFVGEVVRSNNNKLIGKRVVGEINVGCKECDSCKKGLERHCPNRTVLGILNRDGAFAEFLSLPEQNLHTIPDSITDKQAVFVEPLAAAFEIQEQLKLVPNWNVAVIGDGRLAQLIIQVIKLSCKQITCFGHHENKLKKLKKFGIKTKIEIDPGNKNNFDLVIEATGSDSGLTDSLKLVKPRGIIILKSTTASKNKLDFTSAIVNEITVIGSRCGVFKPAISALETGIISVDDLIEKIYPLEEYQRAFEHAQKFDSLKIILKP